MDWYGFAVWTTLSRGWAFIAAIFIILVPLIQEVHAIWRQHNNNLKEEMKNDNTNINSNEANGDINSSTKAGGSKRGIVVCKTNGKAPVLYYKKVPISRVHSSIRSPVATVVLRTNETIAV